jgi:hypothetical protein
MPFPGAKFQSTCQYASRWAFASAQLSMGTDANAIVACVCDMDVSNRSEATFSCQLVLQLGSHSGVAGVALRQLCY